MEYATLELALDNIAKRSFYESATVRMAEFGHYIVEDVNFYNVEEMIEWSYENGMTLPITVIEHSRVHETYEYYSISAHIVNNLPNVPKLLREGKTLHFDYVVVETLPTTPEDEADNEMGAYDGCVGWALIVTED